uniref:AT-rich interaction domain 4B n=1 Tax=Paramormyrops kingsleyae TaxID=1676925 RepID=A0A3B3S8D1_9TELE
MTLSVGASVEVKTQDGVYQEATITKLTDASLYTVVFDDGDEKTLRRSSLCLKGARHFAESETLDQLPLTNPEHFGTPVIGKKGSRGRRSNQVQEEELSSSSSEEEEAERPVNDELLGKVVSVDCVAPGDKKKSAWYPALVISPDCSEELTMKKDTVLVRSFKDGKFYTVLRKDVQELDDETPPEAEPGLKAALEGALDFLRSGLVPASWRMEVKEDTSSSEEEDVDEEEAQEEDASSEEEEEEVEPFPEEKDNFLQQLYKFMEDRGTPINKRPVLGYRNLNLFKLYRLVHKLGGFDSIDSGSVWKQVYQDLGIPVLNSAAGYNVKCAYRKYLYGFEEYCSSSGISFKMDLPQKPVEKQSHKTDGVKAEMDGTGSSDAPPTPRPPSPRPPVEPSPCEEERPQVTQPVGCKEEKTTSASGPGDNEPAALSPEKEEEEQEEEEEGKDSVRKDDGHGDCGPGMEDVKLEEHGEQETQEKQGYDEWVKADKIVRPSNKNVKKVKYRKKIKNKTEREKEKTDRLLDGEEAPPLVNSRPHRLAKPPPHDGKSLEQPLSKPVEITSILNGLRASESSTEEESEHEYDDCENEEDESPGAPDEGLCVGERWEGGPPLEGGQNSMVEREQTLGCQDCAESGRHKSEPETVGELGARKRRAEGQGERVKGACKSKPRAAGACRNADWPLSSSPKRPEDRSAVPRKEGSLTSSSSSEDEDEEDGPRESRETGEQHQTRSKRPHDKRKNGLKEKAKAARPTGFWEASEKRPKLSVTAEERLTGGTRPKGHKDVWSSIQEQWPKKTLKELFSDSDTEAAGSPAPAMLGCEEPGAEPGLEDMEADAAVAPDEPEPEKPCEFPGSGSNSVLNTPPTTPESPHEVSGTADVDPPTQPETPASPPCPSPPQALP